MQDSVVLKKGKQPIAFDITHIHTLLWKINP